MELRLRLAEEKLAVELRTRLRQRRATEWAETIDVMPSLALASALEGLRGGSDIFYCSIGAQCPG